MATFDGDWQSFISGVDDGLITVRSPKLTLFDGTHQNTHQGIFGQAIDGAVPHITFVRRDGRCMYLYDGDIRFVPAGGTVGAGHFEIFNGTVTATCRRSGAGVVTLKSLADDDWTAEKPT
jgi:hypothetical protein